ncbi:hypothetical protein JTE90_022031 [Oedothorax gibbosus]|uniref:Uncharacterized protein n=1 Tax=Oedothorax gibbosus TaxID=931172 RepID=A0AAV6V364_9ARAC|nr:hypothetical protein JTE90_022031 [Oedothorax gibbosus]
MLRLDTNELIYQDGSTQADFPVNELENFLPRNSLPYADCQLDPSVEIENKPQSKMKCQRENIAWKKKDNESLKIYSFENNGDDKTVNQNLILYQEPSEQQEVFPRKNKNNMSIRYTRQYLLNCRFEPQSTAFPDCLLEHLQSGNVPLKQEEDSYAEKSMHHILFYTRLSSTRRKPFQQRYF